MCFSAPQSPSSWSSGSFPRSSASSSGSPGDRSRGGGGGTTTGEAGAAPEASAGSAGSIAPEGAAAAEDATVLWLGTHERNRRAQKAYRRRGFRLLGSRTYDVGGQTCRDVVMSLNPQEVHNER